MGCVASCANADLSRYCTARCATFVVCVLFSVAVFCLAVSILAGAISFGGSDCYATGLIGTTVALWVSPPRLQVETSKKDDQVVPI